MTYTPDELERAIERVESPVVTLALADLRLLLSERAKLLDTVGRMRGALTAYRNGSGNLCWSIRDADLQAAMSADHIGDATNMIAPVDAVAWRDIATAPRDGREIIAYSQDVSGTTGLNPFVSLCEWHPDAGFCTCELREVTHWMPLPPPPSADLAPSKPSAETGELRERVARLICRAAGHNPDGPTCDIYFHDDPDFGKPWAGYRKAADAILDLIQSEKG